MSTNINDLKAALLDALAAEKYDAVAELSNALILVGDEGDPPGTHRYYRGIALLCQQRLIDALPWLKAAGDTLPPGNVTRAKAWANVAHIGAKLGLGASLKEGAQRVIDEYSGRTEVDCARSLGVAHQTLGQLYAWEKDHLRAAQHHRLAAEVYPDPYRRHNALCDQAYELALAQAYVEAQQVLDSIDPKVMDHYASGYFAFLATQSVLSYQMGAPDEALRLGEQALKAQTSDPGKEAILLAWLCRSSMKLNKVTEARAYLRKARTIMTAAGNGVVDELTQLEMDLEGVG